MNQFEMTKFSTSNIASRFNQHGNISYEFSSSECILYTYARGPFNTETIESLRTIFFDEVAFKIQQSDKPYIEILFCGGSGMATPEAMDRHNEFLAERKKKLLQPIETIAILIDIEESVSLMESLWSPSWENNSHPIIMFDSIEKAQNYKDNVLNKNKSS